MDIIVEKKPDVHIFNVGNKDSITVNEWVKLCYNVVGKEAEFVNVMEDIEQRSYFCFTEYEYMLDTEKQDELIGETMDMAEGLKEAFEWYKDNQDKVNKRSYFEYIDEHLA